MFDHVSIGVSDIKRAGAFYDAVLKPLDVTRLSDGESALESFRCRLNRKGFPNRA